MSDIFSADGSGEQFLSWNAKDHYFALNKESVDIADLYVDALSFRAGWANFNTEPKLFVYGKELGETIEQPGDDYKNAWYVDAHLTEYGDVRFSWFSWSVVKVFRKLYPKMKDQPAGKLSRLKVTSDLQKDGKGNAGPGLEFVGFVDKPGDSAPAPAAAADDDTVF